MDFYLIGATHIITLVKAEFLWCLGAFDQVSTESCGGTSSGWIFRDIIEGVKHSCLYGAVAAGLNILTKAAGLRISLGKSFQRVDIYLGLREYEAIGNLCQGELQPNGGGGGWMRVEHHILRCDVERCGDFDNIGHGQNV